VRAFLKNMMARCKNVSRYKGSRVPKCAGGTGCRACWAIYRKASGAVLVETTLTINDIRVSTYGVVVDR
jgi:hypothetical protein